MLPRKLYWMETTQNQKHVIMQSNTDGRNIEMFFGRNRQSYTRTSNSDYIPCNCPDHELIDRIFAIDHSDATNKPQIIFIDSNTNDILSSDAHGCLCNQIVDQKTIMDTYPILSLAVDKQKIYWSNGTLGQVYSMNKNFDIISAEKMTVNKFYAFGSHMQPYPASKCLVPVRSIMNQVQFFSRTFDSITIKMPPVAKNDGCSDISIGSVEYTVYYKNYEGDEVIDDNCANVATFESVLKISGLRPFSRYLFAVSVSNYYSDLENDEDIIGPAVVFQTSAGGKFLLNQLLLFKLN